MRRLLAFAAASLLGTLAVSAQAAGDCPDGDWFCEPAPPAAAPSEPAPRPAPPMREPPPPPLPDEPPPDEAGRIRFDVPSLPPPRPRHRRGYREWGINLHALIGLMGSDVNRSRDADMNGLGGALRFRPIPYIAVEGAVELAWGTDYNGFQRSEQALLANVLFFANPHSAVQLYGLAGFGGGVAFLDSGTLPSGEPVLRDETYTYLSGQLGIGLEGRITRHFALTGDLIGFLRTRTDRHADRNPEFVDPVTHETTNDSGGGLVRLGATFYW